MIIRNRMAINDIDLHKKFKLTSISYTNSELKELAYDLVKEGSPFEKTIGDFLSDWLDEKATIIVKTSGSTGTPKEILLQKHHMVNSAFATGDYFELKEGDTALLCLSADYIAGKMMLVRAMVLGLHLDYVEPSSNPLVGVSKHYDFAAMVPLQLENSIAKIELIKTLIIGGATVSMKLKAKVQEKYTDIYETYGMTETITHVAVKRINKETESSRIHFNALPNINFSIDERACLVIAAPKVSDGLVVTNDVVNLISETKFKWLGRYDNVINSGGIKLFPEQIEAKLAETIQNRFFVAALPDEKLGQKLILVVEGSAAKYGILQIIESKSNIKKFEIPKNVFYIATFCETASGKIDRARSIAVLFRNTD